MVSNLQLPRVIAAGLHLRGSLRVRGDAEERLPASQRQTTPGGLRVALQDGSSWRLPGQRHHGGSRGSRGLHLGLHHHLPRDGVHGGRGGTDGGPAASLKTRQATRSLNIDRDLLGAKSGTTLLSSISSQAN